MALHEQPDPEVLFPNWEEQTKLMLGTVKWNVEQWTRRPFDPHLEAAMLHVPRHEHVDLTVLGTIEGGLDCVYLDCALPHRLADPESQQVTTISQPSVAALMMQEVLPREMNERHKLVLGEIGCGLGYVAQVLSRIPGIEHVYGFEIDQDIADQCRVIFSNKRIQNITIRAGDGIALLSDYKPFDGIIISAEASKDLIYHVAQYLKPGGILVAPLKFGTGSSITRYEKKEHKLWKEIVLPNCGFVPIRRNEQDGN